MIAHTPLRLLNLGALSQLPHPDPMTFQGRNTMHSQHPDTELHMPLSPSPFSVVVTTVPMDISMLVVASEHWEVPEMKIR
jgi:hypothetical protein